MDKDSVVSALSKRLGTDDTDLLSDMYDDALAQVLDYTNRTKLVGNMGVYVKQLVIVMFNRQGTEGDSSRSEGGVSESYEIGLPSDIKQALMRYRTAKVVTF
ncbi:hypothetical protein lacNasYZ03_11680 [Lactobacillus nasalidis]|uniref:DNA-packaging protein n=1 Tax=Lactobacillus nasalidis TaxID=2797258 RepID=A0ABQ3W4W2_9LACO|nr:phage head-tail connector protein [Lactobacillus nasalidis]GHV97892.1 hypothetical protein lacNasYZ01_10740 [Lactobacillus nasalidis]GHW00122.1 hypothetical protein lacNasYZ02_15510 [Lactobacillus nasalidis]GHW01481.1 hypothetical protein lacNasYZ03_11680 [Lactobacillus nasalidis]